MELIGLREYLDENYSLSVFGTLFESGRKAVFHLHGHRVGTAMVKELERYDITLETDDLKKEKLPKHNIKMVYEESLSPVVPPLIKTDMAVKSKNYEPIISGAHRNHIKNKTLFPLMKDRTALFFTLLEGEIIKGIILGFSRYEITVGMKGGVPVTILRHAVYDLRNKKKRCYLKKVQHIKREWKKTPYYAQA